MRRISTMSIWLVGSVGLLMILALLGAACSDDEPAEQSQSQQVEQEPRQVQPSQQQQGAQPEESAPAEAAEVEDEPAAQQTSTAVEDEQQQQQVPEAEAQTQADEGQPEQDAQPQPEETETPGPEIVLGGDRPARLLLPQAVDLAQPRPLIVLLHGYSSFARQADQYFQFSLWVDKGEFGLLLPNGTLDEIRNRFWNATPECCDIFGAEPDDVGYIKSLIAEARTHAEFDQVFAVGHSNGGFMAYRLACEEVPGLAGIVSLAGGAFADPEDCRAPAPLSVLQIHGTDDGIVLYEGGRLPDHPDPDRQPVPGAKNSVLRWVERAGCNVEEPKYLPAIDTDTAVEGAETSIVRFADGCAEGTVMELWKIEGGGHIPLVWETDFTPGILKWLAERYGLSLAQDESPESGVETHVIGGDRPADLLVPAGRGDEPMPLVLSLHGYGGDAEGQDWYFGLSQRVSEYGFALVTAQGTADSQGNAFWNATDGCCNFHGSEVDDHGWLNELVAETQEIVNVSGVYAVGYSNGGFMSYRLACDGLDGLVAIASLAGSSFGDPDRCSDATPVSVLQIHGTEDMQIPYEGTLEYEGGYPSVVELIARWAERAGCHVDTALAAPNIDLDSTIVGAETSVQQIREGCAGGITIELWTIEGANHFLEFQDDWPDRLVNWLLNESRTN